MADPEVPRPKRVRKSYPPIQAGDHFGRLTVLIRGEDYCNPAGATFARWWLQCGCGKKVIRHQRQLHSGQSRDCGCGWRFQSHSEGVRFGILTVTGPSLKVGKYWKVPCRCDCGRETMPFAFSLSSGETASCGLCQRFASDAVKQAVAEANTRHGGTGSAEYRAWYAMRRRCNDPKNKAYKNYGGRGIRVCDEWQNDFQAFLDHVGIKPSPDLSLDRIDNERGYEPGNVRWADQSTQSRNRRPFIVNPRGAQQQPDRP